MGGSTVCCNKVKERSPQLGLKQAKESQGKRIPYCDFKITPMIFNIFFYNRYSKPYE